tara:strand:- start:1761 stop:2285 length:525 start_codon:yes stop_codon:yes gene_type:complete
MLTDFGFDCYYEDSIFSKEERQYYENLIFQEPRLLFQFLDESELSLLYKLQMLCFKNNDAKNQNANLLENWKNITKAIYFVNSKLLVKFTNISETRELKNAIKTGNAMNAGSFQNDKEFIQNLNYLKDLFIPKKIKLLKQKKEIEIDENELKILIKKYPEIIKNSIKNNILKLI